MKKFILVSLYLFSSLAFALPLQKLTVILDWLPNPDHAPLIIAKQQGFFEEQGLDVELVSPTHSKDSMTWVATGKANVGIAYQPEFMEQVDYGLPLVRIGALIDKPLNCLVVLKSSNIKTPLDLKGKRIGITKNGLSGIMLKTILAKEGLTEKDVKLIDLQQNFTQALLIGKVDGINGLMRNLEVPQLEGMNKEVITFFPEEHGIPNYSELIFIANRSHVEDRRFPLFLKAIKKAVAYIDTHPEQSWEQFIKRYPDANNKVNRIAWFDTMPYFAEEPASYEKTEWQQFAKFMQKNHLIKNSQPVSRYVTELKT